MKTRPTLDDLDEFEIEYLEHLSKNKTIFCHFFAVAISLGVCLSYIAATNFLSAPILSDYKEDFFIKFIALHISATAIAFLCFAILRNLTDLNRIDDILQSLENEAKQYMKARNLSFKAKHVNVRRLFP